MNSPLGVPFATLSSLWGEFSAVGRELREAKLLEQRRTALVP